MTLVLRTTVDPAALAAPARREVWALDKDLAVSNVRAMREVLATSVARPRFTMLLLSTFAWVALALAAVPALARLLGDERQPEEERARAARAQQLEDLLQLRQNLKLDTISAVVIGSSASPDFRGMTIDKGSGYGVAENMAVIASTGVVGRIVTPAPNAAKVQLVIDQNAAAGALVERSRAQGIVVGRGTDTVRMDFVPATADVILGDAIVTSGVDGIYPQGFVIGKVVQVNNGNGIYKAITVRPSVDFNRLEEVLVIRTPPQPAVDEAP
jgi:rod shape-determining protein MreC